LTENGISNEANFFHHEKRFKKQERNFGFLKHSSLNQFTKRKPPLDPPHPTPQAFNWFRESAWPRNEAKREEAMREAIPASKNHIFFLSQLKVQI
jgi:hypothetical protein